MTNSWHTKIYMAWNRMLRESKNAVEESELLENAVPMFTRSVDKWAIKIFGEWSGRWEEQIRKPVSQTVDRLCRLSQIQDLETNICDIIAESPNFWLTRFIKEECKDTYILTETYPPLTRFRICSVIQKVIKI